MLMMHLSRMSEELILWSSQEFNFISFDDAYCTGSSIMPQKKNPDIVELGRGKTGRVYGALISVLTMLKGLPLAYNKDMQEDKEPLFDVIKQLSQTLTIYPPLLRTLKINNEIMQEAATVGYLNATLLAEYLVKKGLQFRSAHEIVGKMVTACIDKKCRLEELSLQEMNAFSSLISDDIYEMLAINNAVEATLPLASINEEIDVYENKYLRNTESWVKVKEDKLNSVYRAYW
jgi:argininosuccinate lyase